MPLKSIRRLGKHPRLRRRWVEALIRDIQRLEKALEDAGIKIGVVASLLPLVSTRAMIEQLIAGTDDPEVLAELAL